MTLKNKIMICIFVLLLTIIPAAGALNEFEAGSAASKYQQSNEIATAYGPYTYMNHPYYYVEFKTNGSVTGIVIIDGISGEPANLEDAKKISYAYNRLLEINASAVSSTVQDAADFRNMAQEMKGINDEINKNNLLSSPSLNTSTKQQMADLSRVVLKMEIAITSIANNLDRLATVERSVLDGNKSYENAKQIKDISTDISRNIDDIIHVLEEANQVLGADASMEAEITQMKIYNDELKRYEEEMEKAVDWDISSMESRTASVPGFGIVFAIAAVLISCALINKKRE